MNVNRALPTLREELDRKSFETIEWLFNAVDKGQISKFQFATGIDTLFMTVSGICDSGIFELVTAANTTIGPSKPVDEYHLLKGTVIVSMKWALGHDFIQTIVRKAGVIQRDSNRNFDTPADAKFFIGMAVDRMVKEGYERL